MNTIYTTFNDMIKMSLFSKIRTNNPVIDSIISTIILTFMSYIVKVLYEYNSELTFSIFEINIIEKLKYCYNMIPKYYLTADGTNLVS